MKDPIVLKLRIFVSVVSLLAVLVFTGSFPGISHAAQLTQVNVTMASLKAGATVVTRTVNFTTPVGTTINANTANAVVITWPNAAGQFDFTGIALSNIQIAVNGAATTTPAAASGVGQWGLTFGAPSSTVWTFVNPTSGTSSSIAAGSKITVVETYATDKNPAAAGNVTLNISSNSSGGVNTGSTIIPIIGNDTVTISSIVPQSLQFAISTTTLDFGTFTPGVPRYASTTGNSQTSETMGNTLSVTTNAANGYTLTATGTTLTNGTYTVAAIGATAAAANAGAEQFGFRLGVASGPGTVQAPFATAAQYAFVPGALNVLASMAGPGIQTVYNVFYEANVIGTTKPGAYSSAITYAATANF